MRKCSGLVAGGLNKLARKSKWVAASVASRFNSMNRAPASDFVSARRIFSCRCSKSRDPHYYDVSGQLQKGLAAWEMYHGSYPRDGTPLDNLAGAYFSLGQFEKALAYAQEQLRLDPDSPSSYSQVALGYLRLNRLDEARATIQSGLQH